MAKGGNQPVHTAPAHITKSSSHPPSFRLALAKGGPILRVPSLGEATRVQLSRSLVSSVVVHDLEIVEGITEAALRKALLIRVTIFTSRSVSS